MFSSARRAGNKRRLCNALLVDRLSASTTTSVQRSYLLRKWYEAFKGVTYASASAASTTADDCEIRSANGEAAWCPSPYSTFHLPPSTSARVTGPASPELKEPRGQNVGLWLPFLGNKLSLSGTETGRRFFARFSGPKPLVMPSDDPTAQQSWRPSQSEDTYDLDRNIVELLTMDASMLPRPCDPMTYCFWKHGLLRQFEPVPGSAIVASPSNASTFTVCSYNVLCQRTLSYYLEQLYSHCPFEHLTWQRRWSLLTAELQMLHADVFCLQEVQYDHFEQDFVPLLSKLGYDGAFKKKLRKKTDGCATFWRRDKFRPVHVHPVEFVFPAPHDHSDSVALITVLEPVSGTEAGSKVGVVVANTHLIYQPALGATKLCQAALLLAHLQKITTQYASSESGSPAPFILCGDFNSTPFSPLYSLLVDGQLKYEGLNGWDVSGQQKTPGHYRRLNSIGDAVLDSRLLPKGSGCTELCALTDATTPEAQEKTAGRLSHALNLRSVYDHVTKKGEPEVTMFLRDQPVAVDYIFYSTVDETVQLCTTAGVRKSGLRCLERYRLPGSSHLSSTIGYLPNQYCASDHLPLMAKFALVR